MIAVMAFPRTGSSMTAGIFAVHGVWTGQYRSGDYLNAKGHFENLHFKRMVRKHRKTGIHTKPAFKADPAFIDDLLTMNPEEPWLIKASVKYWALLKPLDPVYVCVRRDKNDTLASCQRAGLDFKAIAASYESHQLLLDRLVNEHQGMNVHTQALIDGDYSDLEPVFDRIGLTLDPQKVSLFVDGRLWHFNHRKLPPAQSTTAHP